MTTISVYRLGAAMWYLASHRSDLLGSPAKISAVGNLKNALDAYGQPPSDWNPADPYFINIQSYVASDLPNLLYAFDINPPLDIYSPITASDFVPMEWHYVID